MNLGLMSLFALPAIFVSITICEFTKAFVSTKLGDNIPKQEGRLTLNPFKHFEAIGFILFLLCGFGWGKPVRTSAMFYKDRKKGTLMTYAAPIAANIFAGFIFMLIYSLVIRKMQIDNYYIAYILNYLVIYNISIAVFNLIPVYPMCASKILIVFLSPNAAIKMSQNEKIFQMILMLLIFFGFLGSFLNPITNFIIDIFELLLF